MENREEKIRSELINRFDFLRDKVRIQRPRRVFADVPAASLKEVFKYTMDGLGFIFLCSLTGLDEGQSLSFLYHMTRQDGMVLTLKISVPRDNPVLETVTDYFKGADIYERELMDLFGAKVKGLPEGKRYPLPDDWPKDEYPLRKDWKKGPKKNA